MEIPETVSFRVGKLDGIVKSLWKWCQDQPHFFPKPMFVWWIWSPPKTPGLLLTCCVLVFYIGCWWNIYKTQELFPPQFVWLTFQKLGCGCGNRDQLPCIDLNTSDVLEHAQTNLCLKKIYIGFSLVKPLCYVLLAFHGINYGKTMLNRVQRNQRSLSITNPVKSNIDMRYSKYPCLKGYTTFSKPSPIASMYVFTYTWMVEFLWLPCRVEIYRSSHGSYGDHVMHLSNEKTLVGWVI